MSRAVTRGGILLGATIGALLIALPASSARADETAVAPAPPAEPLVAPAGAGFYPTATYAANDVPPRPVDAGLACDEDDPQVRADPRCRDVDVERSSSMTSPALVVAGGALTVVGVLGVAGGVALAGYESGPSSAETSLNCRAGTSGIGCDPSVDTSGAVDVLATVGGVGLAVVGGAVAITGVTLVVVGAVPRDDPREDEPPQPSVQFSVAPARVSLGGSF